jgi:hypothetical protein
MVLTKEQEAQARRTKAQATEAVERVIAAGFAPVLSEIRLRFALCPTDVFSSSKRPAPAARGLLYVRMCEKGWSTGRIAVLVGRDVSSVRATIERYHRGAMVSGDRCAMLRGSHWLGPAGVYVDGLWAACTNTQPELIEQ